MAILFSNEIMDAVVKELHRATDSVQIITAYCKEKTLKRLDYEINAEVKDKRLLVRFRLEDLLKGSTDFGILQYGLDRGWKVYVRFDLHAKTYIVDNKRGLVGSANVTNSGFNLGKSGNMEMAAFVDIEEKDIKKIANLFKDAVPVTEDLLEKMKKQLEGINANKTKEENRWDDSIRSLFNPQIETLFSYELPESFELKKGEYFAFLDEEYDGNKENLKNIFRWSNSYLWLLGTLQKNKGCIRRYVTEGGRVIPGASTIHFDEISRKRIFQAIDNANFSDIKLIRENYTNLKNKLGHIPALADFDKYGEMDVLRIFDNNSLGSYYKFLVKYEKEYTIRLSEDEEKAIEFISKKLASGKRIHELELLKRTLQYHHGIIGRLRKHLSEKYQCEMDEHCTENVVNMMTNEFSMSAAKKTYAQCVFLKKEQDDYGISDVYGKMLQNPEFCAILEELVDFGISRYKVNYSYHYQDTNLVLYQKYTYEDACRLLNWERNEVPLNIGGYKYDKKTKTFPIFINYDKQDNISDTTKYEDHFVAENRLIAISKSGRSMDSEDVQNFLKATERGIDVQLFVRKNKDDKISKEFYYLGRVIATGNAKQFVIPNTDKTAVEIEWELETPVREDIYQYIVNE